MPSGLLVVPTAALVAPGTAGVFYLSLETANFSGTGSTTFQLTESGSVVLQLTVDGSAIKGNTKTIIAQAGAIPAGTYAGPANLSATTTVTPLAGGSPATLTANTSMWVVAPAAAGVDMEPEATRGARAEVAQSVVGFGIPVSPSGPEPCVGTGKSGACYGVPSNILVLALNLITGTQVGGLEYVVIQTGMLNGYGTTLYQLVQGGKVISHFTQNDPPFVVNKVMVVAEGGNPAGASAGPATLIATTTVAPRNGGNSVTVKGGVTLQIIQ